MSPHQRHGGARRPPEIHVNLRPVRLIPNLLGQKPRRRAKAFHGSNEWLHVVARGELVMPALAREQGPGAALPPGSKRTAVLTLSISVVIVAVPAGAEWRINLEHGVHHPQGIHDERIIRFADPVADQLKKTPIDNFLGREDPL